MRNARTASLLLATAALIGVAAPSQASDGKGADLTVEEARSAILGGCTEAGGEDEACLCYVDSLQETLPGQSYERMMILAAYAMAGDDEAGLAFMKRNGLADTDFLPMMIEWQEAVLKSSQQCGL